MFKETDLKFQETDRKFQETDRQFKETDRQFKETDRQFKETDRKFQEGERRLQETERLMKEQSRELDRRFQETERLMKERSRELDRRIGELGGRLGDFVEGLIKPSVARLFQERGIPIHKTYSDVSANNPELALATQIDLFVINNNACALIEVKSKLSVDDVNDHLERMEKFKPLFPEYADKKAFGAVAAMVIPEDVARYAYRKGFFIIAQKGDTAEMLNDAQFEPRAW
jgi:hypothetical protein